MEVRDPDNTPADENNAVPTQDNDVDTTKPADQTNFEDNQTPADGTLPDNNQAGFTYPKPDT